MILWVCQHMFECINVHICTNIFYCCLCLDDCAEQLHTFIHECTCAVLYALMRAGKNTCINRSAKRAQTYTGTCTHVHPRCLTFHLWFVLCQTSLLPPQLSMRCHHLWPLDSRLSLRPSFLNSDSFRSLAVSPPKTFRPQRPLRLCSPWPFTPSPWPLLLYRCAQRIRISVDRLCSTGVSVSLKCPWNPLGCWYESWSIGELAWKKRENKKWI